MWKIRQNYEASPSPTQDVNNGGLYGKRKTLAQNGIKRSMRYFHSKFQPLYCTNKMIQLKKSS
jgi:hypothetical protein